MSGIRTDAKVSCWRRGVVQALNATRAATTINT